MTPEAIRAIKASYATVATQPRQLASRFYQELFAAAPNCATLALSTSIGARGQRIT